MATLSHDLRERIVSACDRGDGTRQEIADRYDVSLGMVKKLLAQRKKTGDIGDRHRFSGARPKITGAHKKKLRRLVQRQPDLTLEELRDAIEVDCTPQAVFYALEDLGLTLKKRRSCPPN